MKRKHTSFTKLFYIIGIFIFLNISSLFSKNSPINFSFINQPLKLAIDSLVFTYDLNIVYRDQIVNDIMINAICNNCNSDEAIQSLLDNTYLDWKKNNYQYIIINNKKIETISGYIIDDIDSEKFIGGGTVLFFFVAIPLFLYYRWKNKKLRDFILNNEKLKKINEK